MKKERIKSLDFIKSICAIGIIIYHFFIKIDNPIFNNIIYYKNVNLGPILVTIFFIISGMQLYYNNSKIDNIKLFYYKRWKSIFPMFYLIYIYFFIKNAITTGDIIYGKNPATIIFTVLGIDGYVLSRIHNYYLIGEWFLGAIVILYVLYPILVFAFNKNWRVTTGAVAILYLLFLNKPITNTIGLRTVTSCLMSFELGMVIIKNNLHKNKIVLVSSVFISLILFLVKLPFDTNISVHLTGVSVFFNLVIIGEILCNANLINSVFSKIGEITYAMFLIQNKEIDLMINIFGYQKEVYMVFLMLILTIILVMIIAKILQIIIRFILKSKAYINAENKLKLTKAL